MLCNSHLAKLLVLVFHHVFNHRFLCCSSMACQLLCLVEFDPFFVTVKQNCACWYLSLVSTFCLHQTSSLHLELCFITFTSKVALSSKYEFSATSMLKWNLWQLSCVLLRDDLCYCVYHLVVLKTISSDSLVKSPVVL